MTSLFLFADSNIHTLCCRALKQFCYKDIRIIFNVEQNEIEEIYLSTDNKIKLNCLQNEIILSQLFLCVTRTYFHWNQPKRNVRVQNKSPWNQSHLLKLNVCLEKSKLDTNDSDVNIFMINNLFSFFWCSCYISLCCFVHCIFQRQYIYLGACHEPRNYRFTDKISETLFRS